MHLSAFRAFMHRLLCVHQTFRAFMSSLSCVHQSFRAFMSRLPCVHQTFLALMLRLPCIYLPFVRSCPNFCAFIRRFVRSWSDFRAFIKPFVRSCPVSRAFIRPFVRSFPDFRAFFLVSKPCKFKDTTPLWCVNLGLDISTFRLGPQLVQTLIFFWFRPQIIKTWIILIQTLNQSPNQTRNYFELDSESVSDFCLDKVSFITMFVSRAKFCHCFRSQVLQKHKNFTKPVKNEETIW